MEDENIKYAFTTWSEEYKILRTIVDKAWDENLHHVDWLGFETYLRAVLKADIETYEQIFLINEAIGAFTKRGRAFPIYQNGQVQD